MINASVIMVVLQEHFKSGQVVVLHYLWVVVQSRVVHLYLSTILSVSVWCMEKVWLLDNCRMLVPNPSGPNTTLRSPCQAIKDREL